ncbi:hypothetical protein WJX77_001491 [Trebouxia sp. C0004]
MFDACLLPRHNLTRSVLVFIASQCGRRTEDLGFGSIQCFASLLLKQGQLAHQGNLEASSFEEVRLEDLDRHTSSDSEEDRPQKPVPAPANPQKAETGSKAKTVGRPPAPNGKPAAMHMIDDDNDMIQPNDKKDVSLRELHDPIEGDSANISWRGNAEVKSHAAQEAKAHDLAGDNPKDFDPFKDAERAAQKAAALAAATVNNLNLKDVSTKLLGGANEAKKGMFSIANDVSSWWANLDPGVPKPSQPSTTTARSATEAQQGSSELTELFDLEPSEELLERFACALLQTYTCSHNEFTPEQQLPFPGTLYITAQHTCFSSCTRDGQEIVVKVQHGQVKASGKIQPKKRGESASLKIEYGSEKHVTFTDFATTENSDLDSAHALIEHLSDAS